jgi:carboxyl-terminal processing protease
MTAVRQQRSVWFAAPLLVVFITAPLLALLVAVPEGAARAQEQGVALPGLRDGIVLQRVPAPDTDTIRWVVSQRSVAHTADLGDGGRLVRLDRFGRKVGHELDAALAGARALVLDLRWNRGGSLDRMLRVAARFIGPVADAVRLVDGDAVRRMPIPAAQDAVWRGPLTVLVGPETTSSGEVLAALLRRFAGATVLGERTFGKDYVLRVEPRGQGWRALVPDGRLLVPGEVLAGGLLPDGAIPADLAASLPNE